MSLRIVYGRAGSGKTTFCLDDIKSKTENSMNKPLLLIVPEQFSLQAERNLIKTLGAGGTMRAEVLSFRRMAYRVFNEVGGLSRPHLNSSGKCMLIYRIIDGLKKDLKFFGRAAGQKGFVKTAADVIGELKRYDITPEMLDKVSAGLEDDPLKYKLSDIGKIYAEFDNALHEKYMDSDDDLTQLYLKLESSKHFDGAEIWIDEFSGFTPQEYKIIERLLGKAECLTVCLCTDSISEKQETGGSIVFSPVRKTASKLVRIAQASGIKVENPVMLEKPVMLGTNSSCNIRFRGSSELGHLEKNLYRYPYQSFKGPVSDVSIFSAANPFSEVEETARDIIRLCRDQGVRYRDIAVVSRSLDRYERLIGSIFKDYGIPCFIDSKREIKGHALVVLILSALDIFKENWSYEAVFRYAKTGLLDIDRDRIDILENYVLENGIRGRQWIMEQPWEFRIGSGPMEQELTAAEAERLNRIDEARRKLVSPLTAFRAKTKGRKKSAEICTALFDMLCEMGIPERIDETIKELTSAGELDTAAEYRQVWNIAMEVFSQTVEVMGEDTVGIERFGEVLSAGFAEYRIGLIPPALDQVTAGSVERSKSHEIKVLYILGANDGVFPAASFDEGILSDRDREKLANFGMELAKDTRSRLLEERFLVYTALTTPSQYLRLSFPAADQEGRALRPSRVISDVRRILSNVYEKSNIVGELANDGELELLAAPSPAFGELVSVIGRQGQEQGQRQGQEQGQRQKPEQLWKEIYTWFSDNAAWQEKCKSVMSGLSYTNQTGNIDNARAERLYGKPVYTSVSRMETYSSCPFSYYVKYGLKAKERGIFTLNPVDIGSFMHNVIDEFSEIIVKNEMSWRELQKDWCSEQVSAIVDRLLLKMKGSVLNSSKRYIHISERLKSIITRAVMLVSEHIRRGGFEPSGYEVEFGDKGRYPAISLTLASGAELRLTGRIDRIDTLKTEDGTYVRIIDYKSGNRALKLSDVYYGLQLQLITYMDAVLGMECNGGLAEGREQLPADRGQLPGGVLYFRLDDPFISGSRESTPEEIEKAIMKELKMKGLLLAEVKLVKEMDRLIDGDSLIIPARLNKGDVLGRSSAATMEQFTSLRRHVRNTLIRLGSEMLAGNVRISPYKKRTATACTYCVYASVCQFDPAMRGNKYRTFNQMGDDEAMRLIIGDTGGVQ